MRNLASLSLAILLAGCVSAPSSSPPPPQRPSGQVQQVPPSLPPPPPVEGFRTPEIMSVPGLDSVIRQSANALVRQFGPPRLDVSEGDMRKLQFSSTACILDIFLYPLRPNGEPVATWVEARRASDGAEVDRAACLQALRQGR